MSETQTERSAEENAQLYSRLAMRLQDSTGALKDDPKLLRKLQDGMSEAMTRLAQKPINGGHPFLFALTCTKPHDIRGKKGLGNRSFQTAATDGKMFYWHPQFLEKLSSFEVSVVMMHECYHVLFDHCRRGVGRNGQVWNWAVDYIVNSTIEEDHEKQQRKGTLWNGALGAPVSLKDLLSWIDSKTDKLPEHFIFADKTVFGRSPESIYDEIMKHVEKSPRKCPQCGGLSSKMPGKGQQKGQKGKGQKGKGKDPGDGEGQGKDKGQGDPSDDHEHGEDGEPCDHPGCQHGKGDGQGDGQGDQDGDGEGDGDGHQCPTCGGGLLPMDEHLMPGVSREQALQEALRAADTARKLRGTVPAGIEDALGELDKPVLTWQDLIRHACMRRKIDAGNKNDWKRFRRRPISFPLPQYMPRKFDHKPRVLAGLDCSGSMGADELRYCVSQLQVLGDDMDLTIVPWDSVCYWDKATKAKNLGDLKRTKIVGRGGTTVSEFFRDFPKKVGKDYDVVVLLSDGYFETIDPGLKPPCDVVFVICSDQAPQVPFGRVAPLRHNRR